MTEDLDRWIACDKCGDSAQAKWLIKLVSGELYFCGHHKNKFENGLAKVSYEMVELNKEEKVPAMSTAGDNIEMVEE
jgi:hypothetical protein